MLYCIALLPGSNPTGISDSKTRLFLLDFSEQAAPATIAATAQSVATSLFSDSVLEKVEVGPAQEVLARLNPTNGAATAVLTAFRPGVTDSTGESALQGYRVMSQGRLPELKRVRTAEIHYINQVNGDLAKFVNSNLINNLIQEFVPLNGGDLDTFLDHQFNFEHEALGRVKTIPLLAATPDQLLQISREGILALNLEEMQAIQGYFQQEGRDPSDVELETLAQTWSEHCVHKTFKALINYTEQDHTGKVVKEEQIDGLFKSGIAAPTEQLNKPWIVSAFSDNAGIMAFDRSTDLSFKAETHNHPSALEPFGGANTGLGGVIRDIMAVSAKPIASTDIFCFGVPNTPDVDIPSEVLPPRRVFEGVVNGVRDYGNKMGIPTVNGAIIFDKGYLANPLVFCGTVGLAPHGSHPRNQAVGDRVVLIGGRTGRDGIHGATFSSIELGGEQTAAETGSVVQIGNPIVEKKVLDLLLKARDKKLYTAITDCGGGGLSSAVGEMGKDLGVKIALEKVPLKYAGLEPWEIWLSEAQERMILAVSPAKLAQFIELCRLEEVEATDLGEFSGDGLLTLSYAGNTVGQLKMEFLHGGLPRRKLEARWKAPEPKLQKRRAHYEHHRPYQGYGNVLMKILADPTIASKESVIRLYDHEVQGGAVVKPLVGQQNDGPGDAAVIKPFPNSNRAIVISNGINPRYGLIDTYHMAACAIDEAVRNAVAVGADLSRMALLDNFCWGNPTVPERLGELTRAVMACRDYALSFRLPFISGKDSLYNEYFDPSTQTRTAIPGTLLISAIAVMADASKAVTMDLKRPGNLLFIVGKTRPELGGSYYSKYHGQVEGDVPRVEAGSALRSFQALSKATQQGLVRSCHDLSEGGIAVAAAEMAFAGELGARLDLRRMPYSGPVADRTNASLLFSETPSRFLVEIEPENRDKFEEIMKITSCKRVGVVLEDDEFSISGLSTATVLRERVSALKAAWQTPLFA